MASNLTGVMSNIVSVNYCHRTIQAAAVFLGSTITFTTSKRRGRSQIWVQDLRLGPAVADGNVQERRQSVRCCPPTGAYPSQIKIKTDVLKSRLRWDTPQVRNVQVSAHFYVSLICRTGSISIEIFILACSFLWTPRFVLCRMFGTYNWTRPPQVILGMKNVDLFRHL